MKHNNRVGIILCLSAGILLNIAWAFDDNAQRLHSNLSNERQFCKSQIHGELFSRTELFFGLSRSDGPEVTEEEFQNFVDTEITPRFPDGLTLLSGKGQFKNSSGIIVQESPKLLILLYAFNPENHQAIEVIRNEYKNAFQQESVLRTDEQQCVSF
ncbi:MAG: DUF3574 domain-containing protein [Candidatus Competibacteraceae bacterium]|nr:DUF3574 domain-containing protein [Candidatus Competibacteraceae bacterium]MBK9951018.1 DUF3574 domain-containing protein [Candidatus Competibacteraceae bacterium]